jgi:hypothetical protein
MDQEKQKIIDLLNDVTDLVSKSNLQFKLTDTEIALSGMLENANKEKRNLIYLLYYVVTNHPGTLPEIVQLIPEVIPRKKIEVIKKLRKIGFTMPQSLEIYKRYIGKNLEE